MPAQLEELMKDLLELAEIESGTRCLILTPFRPVEVVRLVVERHRPSTECRHVELEVQVWLDLPRVIADKEAVRRILDNLLSNGIRHTALMAGLASRHRKRSQGLDSPAQFQVHSSFLSF